MRLFLTNQIETLYLCKNCLTFCIPRWGLGRRIKGSKHEAAWPSKLGKKMAKQFSKSFQKSNFCKKSNSFFCSETQRNAQQQFIKKEVFFNFCFRSKILTTWFLNRGNLFQISFTILIQENESETADDDDRFFTPNLLNDPWLACFCLIERATLKRRLSLISLSKLVQQLYETQSWSCTL